MGRGESCYIIKQKELKASGGAVPLPGQCVEGMTIRKSQGVGGAHAPAQVVLCGAWWEGTARRSRD